MAQNVLDYTYDPTGNELMDDYLPKMAENCLTNNSGIARPTYAVENTVWVDTSDNDTWRYKIYDGTSDIVLFELDNITKKINFPNITGVFRFKGSVATVSALPATGNLPGDVYNVIDGGANYAWNGSEWDKLSENLEWGRIVGTLSNQTDLQNALDAKQPTLVSGTNIKTVNGNSLLGSGDISINADNIFWANYGTTTYADMLSAINDGKLVLCIYNGSTYYYDGSGGGFISFTTNTVGTNYVITVDSSNNWTNDSRTLQEKLISAANIKTINNRSLLGSGNITIQPSPDLDNKSITKNTSQKLQTVGVIDSNDTTNAIKTWTGTKAQYNAIASKDPNTLYNITDDTDVSLTILETLYPVGSIYITTANTCPLSALISGSRWELVSSGRVLQGADNNHIAGTTIEAGLPNITGELKTYVDLGRSEGTGAIRRKNDGTKYVGTGTTTSGTQYDGFDFDASRSNSIYGNSSTVQPPAYVVNICRRTA